MARTKNTSRRGRRGSKSSRLPRAVFPPQRPACRRRLQQWLPAAMAAALASAETTFREEFPNLERSEAVGRMNISRIAKANGVPRVTLRDRFIAGCQDSDHTVGHPTVFTGEQESELVDLVIERQRNGLPLTIDHIRRLAFSYAEQHDISHHFNREERKAGWHWWSKFRDRHSNEISLRAVENVSRNRVLGMERSRIQRHFRQLEQCLTKYGLMGEENFKYIYNVDETGLTTVPDKRRTVIAQKGARAVQAITSAERGSNTTAVVCCNAVGDFIPDMVIFKGSRLREENRCSFPPNTLVRCSKNGWIDSGLFMEWFQHFVQHIQRPNPTDKVLLFFDGHGSHENPDLSLLAQQHNVILFELPSHSSAHLQPLDVGVFRSFKKSWQRRCSDFMNDHPGLTISRADFGPLFTVAYETMVSKTSNVVSAFRKAGICPLDPTVVDAEIMDMADSLLGRSPEVILSPNSVETTPQRVLSEEGSGIQSEDVMLQSSIEPMPLSHNLFLDLVAATMSPGENQFISPASATPAYQQVTVFASTPNIQEAQAESASGEVGAVMALLTPVLQVNIGFGIQSSAGGDSPDRSPISFADLLPASSSYSIDASRALARIRDPKGHLNPSPEKEVRSGATNHASNDTCPACFMTCNNPRKISEWFTCLECARWFHVGCGKKTAGCFICSLCIPKMVAALQTLN